MAATRIYRYMLRKIQKILHTGSNETVTKKSSTAALQTKEAVLEHHEEDNRSETVQCSCKPISPKSLAILDPDENFKNDPQWVTEYVSDIFDYLRTTEIASIREGFLNGHGTTPKMRAKLIHWLVGIHWKARLDPETLHFGVEIVDRYLQGNKKVSHRDLQLLGATAIFVACKYDNQCTPALQILIKLCHGAYTEKDFFRMEWEILKGLNFSLGFPLPVHFLRRYYHISQACSDHQYLGMYLLEIGLLEHNMCHVVPSLQAAAVCCLSLGIMDGVTDLPKLWTPALAHYTRYGFKDFENVLVEYAHLLVKGKFSEFYIIRTKYASAMYRRISLDSKLNCPLIKQLTSFEKPIIHQK